MRLTTTNGLYLDIDTTLPSGAFATVISARVHAGAPLPPDGQVLVGRMPARRFETQ